jgi:hypothetical protein
MNESIPNDGPLANELSPQAILNFTAIMDTWSLQQILMSEVRVLLFLKWLLSMLLVATLHSIDDGMTNKCEADYGLRVYRGNRRRPTPVLYCPPQIPHDVTWDWMSAAVVVSRQLTAWAMTRPAALKKLIRYYCNRGSGRILSMRKLAKEVGNIEIVYS